MNLRRNNKRILFSYLHQVKIWFQNRRMKWKRSKKAQQEAKEKKSSSSSSSSSSSANSGSNNANVPSAPVANADYSASTLKSLDKSSESLLSGNHGGNFHVQKTHSNMDEHRHIVNLAEYGGHLDDGNLKLNRRPIIFAESNQNGDMFRPYVV